MTRGGEEIQAPLKTPAGEATVRAAILVSYGTEETSWKRVSRFNTRPRWEPVAKSPRSRRSYGKIGDCERSAPISGHVRLIGNFAKHIWRTYLWSSLKVIHFTVARQRGQVKIKMAAATARPIPVVNNVMTDEDLDNLRTDGKVRTIFMQRCYYIRKN